MASGKGSNAKNICAFFKKSEIVSVKLICSNKKNSPLASFSNEIGVNYYFLDNTNDGFFDKFINYTLALNIDFIVLAGFLLKVPKKLVELYNGNIINIHPSLLPKYGGKGMYGLNVHRSVIKNNDSESGFTVHYVNKDYDEGDIIFQKTIKVATDDPKTLAKKVLIEEHKYYPEIIKKILYD